MQLRVYLKSFLQALALVVVTAEANSASEQGNALLLMGDSQVRVTSTEVLLFLEHYAMESNVELAELSGQLVAQAILDLYGLKVLDAQAEDTSLYSPQLLEWLPAYLFLDQKIKRYIELEVRRAMASTDWSAEAKDYYRANVEQFIDPESVTVRTLLLRTTERPVEEAMVLAEDLLDQAIGSADFESLVKQYSEDEAGRASAGLMEDIGRGQTVPSFEAAAFALNEPGEFAPPVESEFGVHIIQLLDKKTASTLPFEKVSSQLIDYLQQVREVEYREAIKAEARTREGEGFFFNEEAVDQFMTRLGHDKKSLPVLGAP